jgi:chromosomal replication initiator protein
MDACVKACEAVAKFYKVTIEQIESRSRVERIAFARQVAMYLALEAGATTNFVGDFFNRDHGTASWARKHVKDLCEVYPPLKSEIDGLRKAVQ